MSKIMSKKLDGIRKKIDTLDDRIHDTLMERAALIVDVAEEKRSQGLPFVHPAREAQMIRRLIERHEGPLPQAAVVRIWRELVGAVSLMQAGLKVTVGYEKEGELLWDMAKGYFGSVVPMQRIASPLAAIASVREDESSFAVLPWPHDGEEAPWWPTLFNQENGDIKIVCALPYGSLDGQPLSWEDKALVVSKTPYVDSGEDHSFLILEVDQSVSRGRIVDVLKDLSFEPISVFTQKSYQGSDNNIHLIELNDYVTHDREKGDERLADLSDKFGDHEARWATMGGYPVPPVYEDVMENQGQGFVAPPAPAKASA